jgi:hypothetical protein
MNILIMIQNYHKIKYTIDVLLTYIFFSGKRINRGLFKSSTGKIINAYLNGTINIMRKQLKLTKIRGYRLMSPKRIQIYSMIFNTVDNVQ